MTELEVRINQAHRVLRQLKSVAFGSDTLAYAEACGYAESGVEGILEYLLELKTNSEGVDTRPS